MKSVNAVIFGFKGLVLTEEEKEFFRQANPLGFILFDRNINNPIQLKQLTHALRACVGRDDAPILIDQEGGRVQRMWPPHWEGLPFASTYGDWYLDSPKKGISGVKTHVKKLAKMLRGVGINVDCWPCLDVRNDMTHSVMGKRLFSDDPEIIIHLGNQAIDTMLKNKLMPVVKHIPGYGKASVDPHHDLPVIKNNLADLETDFAPFCAMTKPVWGMTAHVIYNAIDSKNPATLSKKAIRFIRNELHFDGFLITDDIVMGALNGKRSTLCQKALAAGVDAVLHCSGDLNDMHESMKGISPLTPDAIRRYTQAKRLIHG